MTALCLSKLTKALLPVRLILFRIASVFVVSMFAITEGGSDLLPALSGASCQYFFSKVEVCTTSDLSTKVDGMNDLRMWLGSGKKSVRRKTTLLSFLAMADRSDALL